MLNLSEVRWRIDSRLKKLKVLRERRENIRDQIVFWESNLTELRERESELEAETEVEKMNNQFEMLNLEVDDNIHQLIIADEVVGSHIYPKDGKIFLVLVVRKL